MVGRYPFRDPNRMRPEDPLGNRRERDEMAGNRIDRPRDRERDDMAGNRIDRPRDRDSGQQRRPRERPPQEEQQIVAAAATIPIPQMLDMATLNNSVAALVRLLTENGLDELHVENGPFKLTVRAGGSRRPTAEATPQVLPLVIQQPVTPVAEAVTAPPVAPPAPVEQTRAALPSTHPNPTTPQLEPGEQLITSPMVGTFYDGPSPKDPPFVTEGDQVETGQKVGIIEAMKMMNPIEAESAGLIVRIMVRDGQPVEYGQPLMVIKEV